MDMTEEQMILFKSQLNQSSLDKEIANLKSTFKKVTDIEPDAIIMYFYAANGAEITKLTK